MKFSLSLLFIISVFNSFGYWIEGYTDKQSYLPGEVVSFYLSTEEGQSYQSPTMDLYTFDGGFVSIPMSGIVTHQEAIGNTPYCDGYGFSVSCTWEIPADFKSGFYLLFDVIPVIIKCPAEVAPDIVVVVPTNTINAYTLSNGNSTGQSLYTLVPDGAHYNPIVSFQRPQNLDHYGHYDDGLYKYLLEYNHEVFVGSDFVIKVDYQIEYIADSDMDNFDEVAKAKIVIIPGHSEYWTREARVNFDKFVDMGGNALVLAGNAFWWQIRYEDAFYNEDETKMVCYRKPVLDNLSLDTPLLTSTHWGVQKLKYSILGSIGADWLRGGIGVDASVNAPCYDGFNGYRILKPNSPLLFSEFVTPALQFDELLPFATGEYDGLLLRTDLNGVVLNEDGVSLQDLGGTPSLDIEAMGVFRAELLGYDRIGATSNLEYSHLADSTNLNAD